MVQVRQRKKESAATLVARFNKRVKQSGILKEFKHRRFRGRIKNRRRQRLAASYRANKTKEIEKLKRLGNLF